MFCLYTKQDINGETLAEKHLTRNSGCVSCPIRCERRVKVDGKEVKGPEFETVGLFGFNIDNSNLEWINQINYYADILGMDTISLAGTIAFAMELQEKGMADFGSALRGHRKYQGCDREDCPPGGHLFGAGQRQQVAV